ncbi:hypothetical protein BSAF29S_04381 [Bacillus safensis subsp. safensis]
MGIAFAIGAARALKEAGRTEVKIYGIEDQNAVSSQETTAKDSPWKYTSSRLNPKPHRRSRREDSCDGKYADDENTVIPMTLRPLSSRKSSFNKQEKLLTWSILQTR